MNKDPAHRDFPTVQAALDFIAAHPTMDELMSRRPNYSKDEIRHIMRMNRADRIRWQHNADKRAEKKEENEE